MARKPTPVPAVIENTIDEAKVAELQAAHHAMAVVDFEGQENLIALAQQFGYQGALTVGGIEDEIRFYQQRSVEALLETGKRLLLLKEASPHGEFEQRVELLGIGIRTAQVFMGAAKKTAKSATVALLANRAKDQKAFLELITHDDGVVENLAEMDGFDRMSASQLRDKAREIEKDLDEQKKLNAKKADRITALQEEVDRIAVLQPDEDLADLQSKATKKMHGALAAVKGELRQALLALKDYGADQGLFMAGLVGQVQHDLAGLREEFNLPDTSTAADQQGLAEINQWAVPVND